LKPFFSRNFTKRFSLKIAVAKVNGLSQKLRHDLSHYNSRDSVLYSIDKTQSLTFPSLMSKFTVMFKMPSAGTDAVRQAVEDGTLPAKEEKRAIALTEKFFEYDEYAYIEIDTVAGTARVMPASETRG
jgi:hypothetical protein